MTNTRKHPPSNPASTNPASPTDEQLLHELEQELDRAETQAWTSLSRYKFQMFGYWAAIWVHLNRLGRFNKPNPFRPAVILARQVIATNGDNTQQDSAAYRQPPRGTPKLPPLSERPNNSQRDAP